MTFAELVAIVERCACEVLGHDEGMNEPEREVLAAIAQAFDVPDVQILCEPSIARSDKMPDLVLLHPRHGVLVVEVKGHGLDQIEGYEAGEFRVRQDGRPRRIHPRRQARRAMFDLKNAVERAGGAPSVPFHYRAVFARISRSAWDRRWQGHGPDPSELWFQDDLDPDYLRASVANQVGGLRGPVDPEHLRRVRRALGDTALLYEPSRITRQAADPLTLGARFDRLAEEERRLSDEQRRLTTHTWRGPRLVRGVAGSGKTVVLAMQVARFVDDELRARGPRPLSVLAVCFNRALVPHLDEKVRYAYERRTGGETLPAGVVRVVHLNQLQFALSSHRGALGAGGLWPYLGVDGDPEERARRYLAELDTTASRDPRRLAQHQLDAIFVDEGQDFHDDEFRLLARLCRADAGEPNLQVYYDDAQNVYGRRRPTWDHLGLNMKGGRSNVMKECFRNTHQIVEPAFNVLLGTAAPDEARVRMASFADAPKLIDDGLLVRSGDRWSVQFAARRGADPEVRVARSAAHESELLAERVQWLLVEQQVRPEDVLVLSARKDRLRQLAQAVRQRCGATPFLPFDEKNGGERLFRGGQVTFSTIHSAKGYEAYCVLLASANHLPTTSAGRAQFYVACTRARERLEVFAHAGAGLVTELSAVLRKSA